MLDKFKAGGFQRSVAVVFGGSAVAQIITLLALPVLTRIYDPQDFSLLAVYAAVLGILLTVACLRFEIAIPLPEEKGEAISLLILSLISTAALSLLTLLLVLILADQFVDLIQAPRIHQYLWLLPVGILLGGAFNAFQYWATREKQFGLIAKTRLLQAVGGAIVQISGGLLGGVLGLLLGYVVNVGAGAAGMAKSAISENYKLIKEVKFEHLKKAFVRYQNFPKYSSAEALVNTAGIQLPIIIIAAVLESAEAGFLMLALRVMQAPMAYLGNAIAQVYLSGAPEKLRDGTLNRFTADVLGGLLKLGVGPIVFVGLIGPESFKIVFGDEWVSAGVMLTWMIPWFAFQFVASPISMVMHVIGRQRSMLLLTVVGFLIRIGTVVFVVGYDPDWISEAYVLSGGVFYFICFWVFASAAGVTRKMMAPLIMRAIPIVGGWVALGMILKMGLGEFGG